MMTQIDNSKPYILLVDDTPSNLMALKGLLEEVDYTY